MVYVVNGQVVQRRGWLRLSIFGELFWKAVNFVQFFFTSLITPPPPATGAIRRPAQRPAAGGPGSRPVSGMSNVRGIDHSAAACAPGGG